MNQNDNWKNPQDPKRRKLTKWEKFKEELMGSFSYMFVGFSFVVVAIVSLLFLIGGDLGRTLFFIILGLIVSFPVLLNNIDSESSHDDDEEDNDDPHSVF